ncbi:MAG: molybdopterin-guanine dinucleotide biosynthesis protein B [Planctomycetes bacterium]|nr:molybdopterin-guanine dinucleotide biosynthesis protein B [Planctomycetota bacterium]
MNQNSRPAILQICGFKNSGKTRLIEELTEKFTEQGLRVLAVKRARECLNFDSKGRDTQRLFEAGADVIGYDKSQLFQRTHKPPPLKTILSQAGAYDIALVEGHKSEIWPKIWLLKESETKPPDEVTDIRAVLAPEDDRIKCALDVLENLSGIDG